MKTPICALFMMIGMVNCIFDGYLPITKNSKLDFKRMTIYPAINTRIGRLAYENAKFLDKIVKFNSEIKKIVDSSDNIFTKHSSIVPFHKDMNHLRRKIELNDEYINKLFECNYVFKKSKNVGDCSIGFTAEIPMVEDEIKIFKYFELDSFRKSQLSFDVNVESKFYEKFKECVLKHDTIYQVSDSKI